MSTQIETTSGLHRPDLLKYLRPVKGSRRKVLTIFGTRPEAIKLAPVIQQLEAHDNELQIINVATSQHTDLLYPFINLFGLRVDHDLHAMQINQTPDELCSRLLCLLHPVIAREEPEMILVQGDTTTALAGALSGAQRGIPVGHVEAGLRSGNLYSPYPEEMNRRIITRLATYHFAATPANRETLLSEGVEGKNIFLTGNPVVDSLQAMLERAAASPAIKKLLDATEGLRRIVLTTHRRESFCGVMSENLRVLRGFVERHEDVALIFPVHPNPAVAESASAILYGHPRIHLIRPLDYESFIQLLAHAWLIVSDSGGVQEEAPTLGKPLLILRENTERAEAIAAGVARLVGGRPQRLASMLQQAHEDGSWVERVCRVGNPFGLGDSGKRIARIIFELLSEQARATRAPSSLSR